MVLSFFGKKFQRAGEPYARFQRLFERRIGERRVDEVALPAQFGGRMRIRIGYHRVAVEHLHAAVHERIGRKPRFQRVNVRREVAEMLGMPIGTVTWKNNEALKKLKENLRSEGGI